MKQFHWSILHLLCACNLLIIISFICVCFQNRGTYMFRLESDYVVDATLTGGHARYVNHCCQPNCVAEVVPFEKESKIIIIANRRVMRGEEVRPLSNFMFVVFHNIMTMSPWNSEYNLTSTSRNRLHLYVVRYSCDVTDAILIPLPYNE
jgi:hypothetical protein